jgi:hypothetical protein
MTKRVKQAHHMISARQLARQAVTELRAGWKRYISIIAIVIVPIDLIGLSNSAAGGDATVGVYSLIISLTMNVALIWAIVQRDRTGVIPRMSTAYYEGSVAVVRFFLVSSALVIMLAPAALGAATYIAAQTAGVNSSAPAAEQLLIGIPCLMLALISAHLLIRFGLSLVAVIDSDLRPLAALRYARVLTLGRYWRVVGRYLGLFVLIIAIAVPIAIVTMFLAFLRLVPVATLFFQLVTTFTVLPVTNLYLLRLYRGMEPETGRAQQTKTTEAAVPGAGA